MCRLLSDVIISFITEKEETEDDVCLFVVLCPSISKIISRWVLTCDSAHSCDFIVLSHLDTRQPEPGLDILLSHIILTLSQPVFA